MIKALTVDEIEQRVMGFCAEYRRGYAEGMRALDDKRTFTREKAQKGDFFDLGFQAGLDEAERIAMSTVETVASQQ